jgi:hypothetical protein
MGTDHRGVVLSGYYSCFLLGMSPVHFSTRRHATLTDIVFALPHYLKANSKIGLLV